jgi:hypothetical protein
MSYVNLLVAFVQLCISNNNLVFRIFSRLKEDHNSFVLFFEVINIGQSLIIFCHIIKVQFRLLKHRKFILSKGSQEVPVSLMVFGSALFNLSFCLLALNDCIAHFSKLFNQVWVCSFYTYFLKT